MSRFLVQATWDDAPHLTEDQKTRLWDGIPVHQRDARAKGIPTLGSGVIYPVPEDVWICEPFDIPRHWPRAYGMDVGWNKTAALWGAWDRESDTVYGYSEHYQGQAEPSIHADAIKARGDWIPGAIDPASAASNQKDGSRLIEVYQGLGLELYPAENAVEAGIHAVYQRLASGRLKIFRTCAATISEVRLYRRDENGKIVKENDHLVDAKRYLIMTGMQYARTEPPAMPEYDHRASQETRSKVTGY